MWGGQLAAPVYSTDLSDVVTDMASTAGWTALGGGAGGLVAPETDFFIQGSNCISKAGWSSAEKGMIFNFGSGITVPADGAVLFWLYYWAPNALGNVGDANGGLNAIIGSAATAYKIWHMAGADTLPFAGWLTAAVDPSVSQDRTTGSPGATLQYFGALANVPAGGPSKGQPLGIDAIRYGRVKLTVTEGDLANGYATFSGAASYDGNVARRWAHILLRDGAYYVQGFFQFGETGTAVDFRDSNKVLFIRDTPKVSSAFNRFETVNASSNVEWTNISIQALGTNSPGTFVDTAGVFNWNGCTFIDVGAFALSSSSIALSCTFRRCGQIVAGGADLRNSLVAESTASSALLWDVNANTGGKLDGVSFVSDGSGHGIELGPNCQSNISFTDIDFFGYGADGTTDAALYNNSGKAITIDRSGGSSITVRNGTGASTQINDSVSLTVSANVSLVGAEIRIYDLDTTPPDYGTELAGTESHNAATYVYSGSSGNVIAVQIMLDGYEEFVRQTTMPSVNGTFPVVLTKELNA